MNSARRIVRSNVFRNMRTRKFSTPMSPEENVAAIRKTAVGQMTTRKTPTVGGATPLEFNTNLFRLTFGVVLFASFELYMIGNIIFGERCHIDGQWDETYVPK